MSAEAVIESPRPERSTALFRCISLGREAANRVNVLSEDPSGRLWIGTDAGLYRLDRDTAGAVRTERVVLGDPSEEHRPRGVSALLAVDAGEVWVGTARGLLRVGTDGRLLPDTVAPAARGATVRDISRAIDGTIWVAYSADCFAFKEQRTPRTVGGSTSSTETFSRVPCTLRQTGTSGWAPIEDCSSSTASDSAGTRPHRACPTGSSQP